MSKPVTKHDFRKIRAQTPRKKRKRKPSNPKAGDSAIWNGERYLVYRVEGRRIWFGRQGELVHKAYGSLWNEDEQAWEVAGVTT